MSGGLSVAAQSNCQTSDFVGAAAPTDNYAFDVNIDIGALGVSKGGLLSVIQDVFIAPVWTGIEWVVHALVVMLEWSYTLELLDGASMSGIARALREAQASFTEPWLTFVLAAASIFALYNGLIRRRVADTVAEVFTALALMAIGLWVIADPLGTVGVVGQWANQASLGTLGVAAQGTPASAPRTLGDSMRALFGGAVEMPWCYLEFGNVRWCSDPALLDPRLRKAALSIVAEERHRPSCDPSPLRLSCEPPGDASALATEHSAELVREADTNGKLFLAFPANEKQRNSVKRAGSLLHVLCQAEDDTKCTGPTAAQAEFRSDSGTFPRMLGVVLIAAGVLGMLLLFGLVALHLLIAAVVSLFMLLLAPFAVLAPALGESGRAVFVGWLTRTLGAVTSKLLFSFLLGALLTMQHILMSLSLLGWWTQWLLISACWWAIFLKRHRAIALLQNRDRRSMSHERRPIVRRLGGTLESYGAVRHPVRWTRARINSRIGPSPPPIDERLRKRRHGGWKRAGKSSAKQKGLATESRKGPNLRQTRTRVSPRSAARKTFGANTPVAYTDRRRQETEIEPTRSRTERTGGGGALGSHPQRSKPDAHDEGQVGDGPRPVGKSRSRVMDDARLVAERRKRQLGYGSNT